MFPAIHLEYLNQIDYLILAVNLLIFIFSGFIVKSFSKGDSNNGDTKLYALRLINLVLFSLYLAALFVPNISRQISLSGLTFLLTFLITHFIHIFITRKFGRDREIDGTNYHIETYQSEVFSLIVSIVATITAVLVVINIWGMRDWLEATSALGILAIIVFSTKDVWVPDNISGLILLYNNDIEPGSIIRLEDQNILAIVIQISLTRTLFRDLKTRHLIVLPNTTLRKSKVDILSKAPGTGLTQFVHFNIAYGTEPEKAEALLRVIWHKACEQSNAINADKEPDITVTETGDHAVTWRLSYKLKNYYQILEVECLMYKVAYQESLTHGIGLDTPLTHIVHNKN